MTARQPVEPATDPCVTYELVVGDAAHEIYFKSASTDLALTPEAMFAAALLPHMAKGQVLDVPENIDAAFLEASGKVQDIFACWREDLQCVPLRGPRVVSHGPRRAPTGRVATFFSGGVDSFQTFLRHQDEITDLIFVHGFDIELEDAKLRAESAAMIERVAEAFGVNVIQIETNIRSVMDQYIDWGYGHGAAMAAVAHLLSPILSKVYVPASVHLSTLVPWGSHPLVDQYWGTADMAFDHDGAHLTRAEKVMGIAHSEVALGALRVCWMNPESAYNCGRCEKCQRTMIDLRIAGVLDRCAVFPEPLMLENVRAIRIKRKVNDGFYRHSLNLAEAIGTDHEMIAALKSVLRGQSLPERVYNSVMRALRQPERTKAYLRKKLLRR